MYAILSVIRNIMEAKYSNRLIRVPFDQRRALHALSAESYYVLSTIYYSLDEVSDSTLLATTNFGLSRLRKAKRDLTTKGYLDVQQNGRATYTYTIGGPNE